MKVLEGSQLFPPDAPSPVAVLGNLDGVHLGHRELLRRAREEASRRGGTPVVYTFEPHPVRVLSPAECPPLLCTLPQKLRLLEGGSVAITVVEPFTAAFARQAPKAFFDEVVVGRLHAAAIVVGYDFTFGMHRKGTVETFEALGSARGVEIIVVPAVFAGETLVSSTVIRAKLREGDVDGAARLLGRPYRIEGNVVAGKGLGRTLAARTANLAPANELVPADGIYLTRLSPAESPDKARPSITSIGTNPTFADGAYSIETHVLDEEVDLLGRIVEVEFLARLRDQVRFPTVEALQEQIARDLDLAREFHKRNSKHHIPNSK